MADIKPDTPHPDFTAQAEHYDMMRAFFRGVGAVRAEKETYLPKTAGMRNDQNPQKAEKRYADFGMRATFPGILRHTVSSIVGVTTSKEPKELLLPEKWKGIDTFATRDAEPLRGLQGRVVRELTKLGRVGLMTDLRSDTDPTPVITPYYAHQIINWRTAVIDGQVMLTLLVLKKTESVEGDNYWEDETIEVVEVFQLEPGGVLKRRFEKRKTETGQKTEWVEVSDVPQPRSAKQVRGSEVSQGGTGINGFRLAEIPFTPVNTSGISIDPVDPPFLDLAYKLRDIYVGSANYREAISMYEPTPVFIGLDPIDIDEGKGPKYLGVGHAVYIPQGGDAKMLEYHGDTIKDIRQSLIDDAAEADRLATQPFERITSAPESGESKKERGKSKTNTIREIHLAAAAGIQEALRKGARWTGEDPDKIFFTVDDDLDDVEMAPDELREITSAWMSGLVPDSDAYAKLKSGGMSQLTFEEWKAEREGGMTGAMPGAELDA